VPANKWSHHQGGRKKDPEKVKFAFELVAAGNTRKQIAEYFGISRGTVDYWLKKPVEKTELQAVPDPETPVRVVDGKTYTLELLLVSSRELHPQRRESCPMLRSCELRFIKRYGSAQGACPSDCPGPG